MVAVVAGGDPVRVVGVCAVFPMDGVMVYEVIGLPPLPGAVQDTVAAALPAVAVTPVGAAGAVGAVGVTAFELEAGPVPTVLVAETVNVYAVPLVNPVMATVVAGGD